MVGIQWLFLILCALFVGLSKTGISGILMPVIPVMAALFGGKESTGIILPMLIVGDLFAIYYYNRHANWKDIGMLIPWTAAGLILGVIVGGHINDATFKMFISLIVIICLLLLVFIERKGGEINIPKGGWFPAVMGILSGFASMIGNAAGPIFSIYLIAMGMKKNQYLGTTAWFFFLVNVTKVPLQILFWHNISLDRSFLTLLMIPAIAVGAFLGVMIIKKMNETLFRYFIIFMTAVTAIRLLM
ncbi:MAG: sulfite exporter TauE/SafE family protein [Eubacteriaceae bacterium]|nr:sulfite exporter TauE/SafE family protein [Eubacteriaceae bacterium]